MNSWNKILKKFFGTSVMDVTKLKPEPPEKVVEYESFVGWEWELWQVSYIKSSEVMLDSNNFRTTLYKTHYNRVLIPTGRWKLLEYKDWKDKNLLIEVFIYPNTENSTTEWIPEKELELRAVPKETINTCGGCSHGY